MTNTIRKIGLSLGADLCWPICYEDILRRLDLKLNLNGESVTFDIERVSIEPFDIRQPCTYDLVIDRVTHWYHTSREWIKKAILMDDLYVYNNPWSLQSMEKQTTYCAMAKLGLAIPNTWMLPPKAYEQTSDLEDTLQRYAKLFNLADTGKAIGYPLYMKPYDGGAWKGVSRIENEEQLRSAYEQSGKSVMHLQQSVEGFVHFVRCIGIGPQMRIVSYDPSAPLHDRYQIKQDFLESGDELLLKDIAMTINSFFGWDFNSCESLLRDGVWYPIDFANACPDSQVTSLHYHFPWLVTANIRWSIFCAATKKRMRKNLDWEPYYKLLEPDMPERERISRYAKIGHDRMESDRFLEFCDRQLANLDEVAWDYFESDKAKSAILKKVQSLYPPHEVDDFLELFWNRIQQWRSDQMSRV